MITIEHNKSRRSTNNTNIHKQSLRKKTICEINHLVKTMETNHLDGWEKIRFSDPVDLRDQQLYSTEELFVLLDLLESKFETYLYDIYQEEFYINDNNLSEIVN